MLTRSASGNILHFDPKIELTLRTLRREQRFHEVNPRGLNNMAEPEKRTLGDFAMPDISGSFGGIVAPTIANKSIKLAIISHML